MRNRIKSLVAIAATTCFLSCGSDDSSNNWFVYRNLTSDDTTGKYYQMKKGNDIHYLQFCKDGKTVISFTKKGYVVGSLAYKLDGDSIRFDCPTKAAYQAKICRYSEDEQLSLILSGDENRMPYNSVFKTGIYEYLGDSGE